MRTVLITFFVTILLLAGGYYYIHWVNGESFNERFGGQTQPDTDKQNNMPVRSPQQLDFDRQKPYSTGQVGSITDIEKDRRDTRNMLLTFVDTTGIIAELREKVAEGEEAKNRLAEMQKREDERLEKERQAELLALQQSLAEARQRAEEERRQNESLRIRIQSRENALNDLREQKTELADNSEPNQNTPIEEEPLDPNVPLEMRILTYDVGRFPEGFVLEFIHRETGKTHTVHYNGGGNGLYENPESHFLLPGTYIKKTYNTKGKLVDECVIPFPYEDKQATLLTPGGTTINIERNYYFFLALPKGYSVID